MMKQILGITLAFSCVLAFDNSDEYIKNINSKQSLWKAGRNFDIATPLVRLRGLLGAKLLSESQLEEIPVKIHEIDETVDIPTSFDSRIQWPNCKSIKEIADQSSCGSCWAVSVAATIQDRICIHSNGKLQPEISARNLMACEKLSSGCGGGYPMYAWYHFKLRGLVTGGPYGSKVGCQPYPFAPCEHHVKGPKPGCPNDEYKTPDCVQSCDNATIIYKNDLIHGKSAYLLASNETEIQLEIITNGPVVATLSVYEDFFNYKSGIYVKTTNDLAGLHAVRMIGWGEENGTKYWLVANSWNEDWGDKGVFKIRRGTNECGIEGQLSAGLPKLKLD